MQTMQSERDCRPQGSDRTECSQAASDGSVTLMVRKKMRAKVEPRIKCQKLKKEYFCGDFMQKLRLTLGSPNETTQIQQQGSRRQARRCLAE